MSIERVLPEIQVSLYLTTFISENLVTSTNDQEANIIQPSLRHVKQGVKAKHVVYVQVVKK